MHTHTQHTLQTAMDREIEAVNSEFEDVVRNDQVRCACVCVWWGGQCMGALFCIHMHSLSLFLAHPYMHSIIQSLSLSFSFTHVHTQSYRWDDVLGVETGKPGHVNSKFGWGNKYSLKGIVFVCVGDSNLSLSLSLAHTPSHIHTHSYTLICTHRANQRTRNRPARASEGIPPPILPSRQHETCGVWKQHRRKV
jgi:hypothetical protein